MACGLPLVAVACLAACFNPHPPGPAPGPEVPLADIGREPQALRDRTLLSRGWVVDGGQVAEGTWLQLAVSENAADTVILLLPATTAVDVDGLRGKELEMMLRVDNALALADGRRAVRIIPVQLMAMTRYAPEAQHEVPAKVLARALPGAGGEFFRDPRLPSSSAVVPAVRFTFFDEDLRRPFWYLPGPFTIEKGGTDAMPEYRVTSIIKSEDGHAKESACRFRVDDGTLRSVAYDEVVRDRSGTQIEEEHLDFVSGTVMDKVTGARGPWPPNIYAAPCLGLALSGYPFGERPRVNFFLWSEYEPTAAMYAIVDGTEQVTTPAGTFECYRLRINLDADRMMQRLVLPSEQGRVMARGVMDKMRQPDTVMWLTAAWPHVPMKVEGAMGPPGTSRSRMERVELDAGSSAALRAGVGGPRTAAP